MNGKTGKVIHYAQMAWGASTRIGCGYISFKDNTEPETPFRRVSNIEFDCCFYHSRNYLCHFIIKRTDIGDLYYVAYDIQSLFYFGRTWLKIVFRAFQYLFVVTCFLVFTISSICI
jgi:hypothetical protein